MNYTILREQDPILYIENDTLLITDLQTALDLIATVQYEMGSNKIIIDKKAIIDDFFKLSNGLAGEIIQKFITYQTKLAVIGDYSGYTSKPLLDWFYECNKGSDIFFVENIEQALEKLSHLRN